jgi:hypothetical protein
MFAAKPPTLDGVNIGWVSRLLVGSMTRPTHTSGVFDSTIN